MSVERTDWIEFVPVWDADVDGPEITIEILDAEPNLPRRRRSPLAIVTAALGVAVGVLMTVVGAADGAVRLPGGAGVPSALLIGFGVGFAFLEAIVLVLGLRRPDTP